jgi:hypothetical protein
MEQQILSTTNYSMFKFSSLNRTPSDEHVRILANAIKKSNQLDVNPIVVTKDMQIVSGQHRFLAAKRLGVPIFYIVKDVPDTYYLEANSNQRKTIPSDVVDFYCAHLPIPDYKLLKKIQEITKLSYGNVICLVNDNLESPGFDLNRGNLHFKYSEDVIMDRVEKYCELRDFLDSMPFEYKSAYKVRAFCQGLNRFFQRNLDWDVFMKKVRINWPLLDCAMPNYARWTQVFLKVYSKRTRAHQLEEGAVFNEEDIE